ncbi:MAG: FAD-dependent oxidoreductase [Thermoleophilia bacterium]|nr:FAD-dependent oxidoreductase [Thermoleophilia bacterium]
MRARVAVVGAGLAGLMVADGLMRLGHLVDLFEGSPRFGGLVSGADLAGGRFERFYHVILPTDTEIMGLARDLNLGVRFTSIRTGAAHAGVVESVSTTGELARFSLLSPIERARLAALTARCRARPSGEELDRTRVLSWLRRWVGAGAVARFWEPLLRARFGELVDDLPAQWLYQRTRRTALARRRGAEVHGVIDGGYETLVERLAARLLIHGGTIRLSCPVESIAPGAPASLYAQGERFDYDVIVITAPEPTVNRMLGRAPQNGAPERSLGVVCLRMALRKPLSPYYSINVIDPTAGITGIVDAGHVIDPDDELGHSVTYVPKYVDSRDPLLLEPDEHIEAELMAGLQRVFPNFDPSAEIIDSRVGRASFVEAVRHVDHPPAAPPLRDSALPGIVTVTGTQLWPQIPSGNATVQLARMAVAQVGRQLLTSPPPRGGGYRSHPEDQPAITAETA